MQRRPTAPTPASSAPTSGRSPQPGSSFRLGQLTLGDRLGMGGFGIVYKAKLDGINHPFAVKILHPSIGNDDLENATKRFLREAEVLFRLRHAFIVPIYGVGEHEGRPYILMEYFCGVDLHAARKTQPSPEVVLPFIEKIATALGYAHENNIVHRDITPRNLMTAKGNARVLDFGVAGLLDPHGERFTKTSCAVAGDAFSAPELTENPKLLDPRCDLYSLGACWYWLLTGMSPKGLNWESKLRDSVTIPAEYERVVLRCLDQLDRRYGSASELVEDVRALRDGQPPSVSSHDLSDDQARLLGVIVGMCASSTDAATLYTIQQAVRRRLSPLRTSIALRGLLRRKFVEETTVSDQNYDSLDAYRPLEEGATWAERHLTRIEELSRPIEQVSPEPAAEANDSDDIPF